MKSVKLSKADWTEIYYALGSKLLAIERGLYGKGEKKWQAHLRKIMYKLRGHA